ncbi:putative disease resistance protein RGA4 isoform X1 [Elaeis guineensis]|uniref:Disease resistance protein RGA1 n=1 Tax=Elaeis guineensis var. tenera TaxID=51953 RepID=A0A6I9RQI6_ELAGV|nr:putative disease resistance protein RGA1 [Elaeis guineensis]
MEKIGMMVGELMVSYVFNRLADMVSVRLEERYGLFTGVKPVVEDVAARLSRIREVIQAAEGRPIRDPALATWLRELKDAAYEADDVLDEHEFKELHQKLFNKRKVSDFVPSLVKFLEHLIMSDDDLEKLRNLVGNLDKIYTNINYMEEQLKHYSSNQRSVTRETSSIIDVLVFGRDKERDMILDKLHLVDGPESRKTFEAGSSSNPSPAVLPSLGVLPIVGVGGVGKTTLAQIIYNDKRVARHFEMRKWVYVSDDFDVKRISKELVYDSIDHLTSTHISMDHILGRLKDATTNQRFLFVLDDVWDETGSKWEKLRSALTSGAKGSMVLVTTQSPVVAKVMGTMDPIKLNCLQEDDYWRLFEHCAFGDQILEEEGREKLQAIGRKISEKLHGLPLAGRVLGSLLKTKLDEDHWKMILESEWWEHEYVLDNILPSLALSYEHLNANLKQCFTYCSIFPKSYMFEKDQLVEMWMAQGFVQSKNQERMRMEDIGRQIFNELTSRYFFLPTQTGKYVMHDLIREVAVSVSLDECLVISDEKAEIPATIRHLTLRTSNTNAFSEMCKPQNRRSILFFADYGSKKSYNDMLEKSKSLRVLDLSCSQMKLRKLPKAISRLSHLRYLDISHTMIQELPNSFGELCHLQVLNIRSCYITSFPKSMNKLINLRHLYGDVDTISKIIGIGDLINLQELEEFRVKKEQGHEIRELERLKNLRRQLCIKNLENVESEKEAMKAMLKDKEHLTILHLEWNSDAGSLPEVEKEIFEGLQPHPNIEELEIKRYGGIRFPTWMVENKFLTNLELIGLESCGRLESIPPLGQLPSLKDLHIEYMPAIRKIGPEFYGDSGVAFPSLEVLIFNVFNEWEEWLGADGTQILPRLRNLFLHDCIKLRKVPLLFLSSSLVELDIKDCCDFGSALPGCLQGLTSLINLRIIRYAAQVSLCLSNLHALRHLHLEDCPEMKLVGGLQFLTALELLHLTGCPKLIDSSERGQLHEQQGPRTLNRLNMDDTILLQHLWILLGSLHSLQHLWIHPGHRMTNFTEGHELWFRQLTSLQILDIEDSRSLESLPTSLVNFSTIRTLTMRTCPNVSSLPENDLPTSLKELHIMGCPLLKDRCLRGGADWLKIAHIPFICIDGEKIQQP